MRPCDKVYYFKLHEIFDDYQPFQKWQMKDFLMSLYGYETEADLIAGVQLPSDFTSNAAIYNELATLIWGRYADEFFIKIRKAPYEEQPTNDEIGDYIMQWGYKLVSKLNMTYEYYVPLLTFYRAAKSNLMDDVESTSSNKIKFNDTPQNANTSGVYEGDDYINQFTKTEGVSKSQLTSKINRLREIQDGYKNVMADWVKEFEMLFMEDNH